MGIVKVEKRENPFVQIDHTCINDNRVEYKDLGLLVYLLSKPPGWTVQVSQLMKAHNCGRDAIYNSLRRLSDLGYASYTENRADGGRYGGGDWTVREIPLDDSPLTDNANAVNQNAVNQNAENTGLSNIDLSKTKVSKTKNTRERAGIDEKVAPDSHNTITKRVSPPLNTAIVEECYPPGHLLTDGDWARVSQAAQVLTAKNATPEQVRERVAIYKSWGDYVLHPQAIVKHWDRLGEEGQPMSMAKRKSERVTKSWADTTQAFLAGGD